MIEATVLQTMCTHLNLELHRVYDYNKPMYYRVVKPYTHKIVCAGSYESCKDYLRAVLSGKEI